MPAEPTNVVLLPVRRRAPTTDASLAYSAEVIDGSVKVVIGDCELWFSARDAERFGDDVAALGRVANEVDNG